MGMGFWGRVLPSPVRGSRAERSPAELERSAAFRGRKPPARWGFIGGGDSQLVESRPRARSAGDDRVLVAVRGSADPSRGHVRASEAGVATKIEGQTAMPNASNSSGEQ